MTTPGATRNADKVVKTLEAHDSDAQAIIDHLRTLPVLLWAA